jgi:stage IV sporulation protein FB
MVMGTIAGTKIRLHWTFLVYLVWLGLASIAGGGVSAAVSSMALIIAVFACVVAHEFGHILMARRFGVTSLDVTLLPIGGVARLQAFPERPRQELAVALAGPAVNLAIAVVLLAFLGAERLTANLTAILRPQDILPALAVINLVLALFNLLPAFPMDGGRALRAILAMFLEREKATRIAAYTGQGIAVGLGLLGVLSGNAVLILIALFVYFAASAEAQEVRLHRLAAHLRVVDAMVTELLPLSSSDTLEDAARLLLRTDQREFPVLDDGRLAGILTREGLINGLSVEGPRSAVALHMLDGLPTISLNNSLEEALPLMESGPRPLVVLDGEGRFAGLLTRENLGELLLLVNAQSRGRSNIFSTGRRRSRTVGGASPVAAEALSAEGSGHSGHYLSEMPQRPSHYRSLPTRGARS